MTELDWAALWKRDVRLRPEALGAPGELQFDAVRCDGPWYVGIPWAKAMLTKDPEFTTRHNNDIDIAQSQLDDAKEVLDRAHAALCRDAAVRWLAERSISLLYSVDDKGWWCERWLTGCGPEDVTDDHPTPDAALYAAVVAVLDGREGK